MPEQGTKKLITNMKEYITQTYKKTIGGRGNMGIKKKYLKSGPICKVTFRLPREAVPDAESITIVGDFNNWNETDLPLKKLKNGTFTVTIDLQRDREYQYRYLIDSSKWENDWNADKYIPAPYGDSENSVVVV
jgi:1,4-alpha-glucan branching enzyme